MSSSDEPEAPDPQTPELVTARDFAEARPERSLFNSFLLLLGLSVASLLWLALRTEAPPLLRSTMDFFLQISVGCLLAYAAFRTLLVYPFRLPDLLAIVLVLSLGMKVTIDSLYNLMVFFNVTMGIETGSGTEHNLGTVFQMCLITGSILLVGGALGLRACHMLKTENTLSRIISIVSGMLSLPAAAGSVTFGVLIVRDALTEEGAGQDTGLFFLLWALSIMVTVINAATFIRTMALQTQINASEKMP